MARNDPRTASARARLTNPAAPRDWPRPEDAAPRVTGRAHPNNAHGEEDHAEDFKRGREGQVAEKEHPIHDEVVREALHTVHGVLCVTTCLPLQHSATLHAH